MFDYSWLQVLILILSWLICALVIYPWGNHRKLKSAGFGNLKETEESISKIAGGVINTKMLELEVKVQDTIKKIPDILVIAMADPKSKYGEVMTNFFTKLYDTGIQRFEGALYGEKGIIKKQFDKGAEMAKEYVVNYVKGNGHGGNQMYAVINDILDKWEADEPIDEAVVSGIMSVIRKYVNPAQSPTSVPGIPPNFSGNPGGIPQILPMR